MPDQHDKEASQSQVTLRDSQSIDLTVENASVVDLSDVTPLKQVKGKRRNAATLGGKNGSDSPSSNIVSTVRAHERVLKSIKQEKP